MPPNANAFAFVAVLGGVVLLYIISQSASGTGIEISFRDFRNLYLQRGWVDHVEIVNKETVRVYLRGRPVPPPISAGMVDHDSATPAGVADPPGTVYFRIGSVDTFERQLEAAQLDLHIPPSQMVPVKHVSAVNPMDTFVRFLPAMLIVGALVFLSSRAAGAATGGPGGMNKMFSFGRAKPKVNRDSKVKVTFKDVAGVDEAKQEVVEFVEFLRDPTRFTKLGAKIPKGALLVGPPGTGKTLLAKAVAGEASVPFLSMSGSDFIEMFVGVGPSRVRDLFEQARADAPCIIFIDEIDAVARARNKGGFSGGNDERENTLNQLLVEMDGFSSSEGVVVLAGTNRVDILDKAILRPGRFDRQITVDKPDIGGRKDIFKVHLKPITIKGDAERYAERLAALTPGFAGADIANICNEAAIVAARRAKDAVDMTDFEAAVDRVIGGLEKRGGLLNPEEKRTVAFHEAGHAVSGWFLEHADPLLKVTIVPRSSGALGYAQYLPKELALHSKEALLDRICMALGGRAAEELTFGSITTGASDDLDKVTQIAYAIVSTYGMNPRVGQVSFPKKDDQTFYKPYSDTTAAVIDQEARDLVDACYERTKSLLTQHADGLKAVAERLLHKETIHQGDIVELLGARPFPLPESYTKYVLSSWEQGEEKEDDSAEDSSEGKSDSAEDTSEGKSDSAGDSSEGKSDSAHKPASSSDQADDASKQDSGSSR